MGKDVEALRQGPGELAPLEERLQELERQLIAARQALAHERQRYQELFDLAPDAHLITDPSGAIVEANAAAAALLQERQCDLVGKSLAVFFAEADRAAYRARLSVLQCGGRQRVAGCEIEVQPRSGLRVPVAVTAMAVCDERGTRRSLRWVLRDIRRRRRAEVRLRFLADSGRELSSSLDYERTLQSVAQMAVPSVADWAAVTTQDGGVCHLHAAHRSPAKAELVRELLRCYPPGPEAPEGYEAALRTRRPYLVAQTTEAGLSWPAAPERLRWLLAELHPVSYMVVPLVARERALGVIILVIAEPGCAYDPEDVELAAELGRRAGMAIDNARLYRGAQEAIAARDQFLSAAAHELKTPITNLYGYAQLELRRLEGQGAICDPERVRHYLDVIQQQSARLARLVSQVLALAEIEEGRLSLRREPTDLAALASAVVGGLQAANRRRAITLRTPDPVMAEVDGERISQVLANLVDNALRFSPAEAPVEVELARQNGTAHLSVRDYGRGVPPERRTLLFSRFHQAHTDRAFVGLGLGLYVSRHIVEAHGGHIDASFPPEGGTHMVVSLPASSSTGG